MCIITVIQWIRTRTLNYGEPSSIDLLRFSYCLESKSFVMLDASNSYNELLESKNCTKKVLISHESYNKFNHLNTVNSFHKLIEERLQKYKGRGSIKIYKSVQRSFCHVKRNARNGQYRKATVRPTYIEKHL